MNPTICQIRIPTVIDFCQAFTAQFKRIQPEKATSRKGRYRMIMKPDSKVILAAA